MGLKSNKTLFVFEGVNPEKQIIDSLIKNKIFSNNLIYYAFCGDIYQFYEKIKSYIIEDTVYDYFVDLKKLSNNEQLEDIKSRDEISDIYLFFDYDGHSNYASDEKLVEMLEFFNDETENGKLIISYPMAESLKHIKDIETFKNTIIDCKSNIGYKELVPKECDKRFIHVKKYDDDIWKELIKLHLCKMNYIVMDQYSYPSQIYSQMDIFNKQKEKFIDKENKVSVLSAFPIFIHDYYGNDSDKMKEIIDCRSST